MFNVTNETFNHDCKTWRFFGIVYSIILGSSVFINVRLISVYSTHKDLHSPFNFMTIIVSLYSLLAALLGIPWDIYALFNCGYLWEKKKF
jgi:uncharacterized membrane protein YsdA (DUF1294 family)